MIDFERHHGFLRPSVYHVIKHDGNGSGDGPIDFVFVRHDSAYFMRAWSALAAPDVDFVFVRHDSAYFMRAWSALAAPDVDFVFVRHDSAYFMRAWS
ncbi:MAG: hypothetical protein IJR71_09520, partial [Prevotella sp.]|nr:hypothetical protein [Prevotella sp.]